MQQPRHQEFIRFLDTINASVLADKAVNVIFDDYATHKHPKVRAWIDRRSHFLLCENCTLQCPKISLLGGLGNFSEKRRNCVLSALPFAQFSVEYLHFPC